MQTVTLEFLGAEMEVGYVLPSSDLEDLEIESATIGGVDVAPMLEELAYKVASWAGASKAGAVMAGAALWDALAEAVGAELALDEAASVPDVIRTRSGREVSTWGAA